MIHLGKCAGNFTSRGVHPGENIYSLFPKSRVLGGAMASFPSPSRRISSCLPFPSQISLSMTGFPPSGSLK
jgi:hypothetical protein